MTKKYSMAILVEHSQGKPAAVALELAAWAGLISGGQDLRAAAVLIGEGASEAGREFAEGSGLDVFAVGTPGAAEYNREVYDRVLRKLLADWGVEYVLAAHTTTGLDLMPGLAVGLGASCITAVEGVSFDDGRPVFHRAAYGGKVVLEVRPRKLPAVLTVMPGVVRPEKPAGAGLVEEIFDESLPERTRNLGTTASAEAESDLDYADVIAAAGRGVGKKEKLDLIRRLAALFPRSAVAGSRPICDLGWLEYRRQVGMTGRIVSPKLYIACGVSGARQHVMGMRGSGFVVAVNTDPYAPIFDEADVGVVADLAEFIPVFEEAVKEKFTKAKGLGRPRGSA